MLCVIICLDSPGKPFFRQERIGRGGKRIYIWKLRSMVPDAHSNPERYMTPEQMAYAAERLSEAGAREVHWVPIVAKKGRPAYELQVLCEAQEAAAIEAVVFRETSTLGIRRCIMDRTVLPRRLEVRDTAFGPISVKIAVLPDGTERATPEYEDCAAAARAAGVPLTAVMDAVRASL